WPLATYDAKVDTDANYVRCLDFALRAENTDAVRVGVAGHNLFHIAYAWLLAGERGVRDAIDFEMLLGMAQGQVAAVSRDVGPVLLYVPVVRPDEFDVAISYLVRRLEENASSENFLSAAFDLADDPSMFARERDRFLESIRRASDPTLPTGPNRTQDRTAVEEVAPAAPGLRARVRRPADEAGLTKAVLGIARPGEPGDTAPMEPDRGSQIFGGESFVETAVYSSRETEVPASGAPGFGNAADTDPALAANRSWGRAILGRVEYSTA